MANAARFAQRVRAHGKAVERGVARSVGEYTETQFRNLMSERVTPVLTGFARSRWEVRVGSAQLPALSVPPVRDPSQTYPQPSQPKLKLTKIQSTVTSNNAKYIGILNQRRGIVRKLQDRMRGQMEMILRKNVPK